MGSLSNGEICTRVLRNRHSKEGHCTSSITPKYKTRNVSSVLDFPFGIGPNDNRIKKKRVHFNKVETPGVGKIDDTMETKHEGEISPLGYESGQDSPISDDNIVKKSNLENQFPRRRVSATCEFPSFCQQNFPSPTEKKCVGIKLGDKSFKDDENSKLELMDISKVVEEELEVNVKNENHKIEDFKKIVPDCKIELMDISRVVEKELEAIVKNENHKIEEFEKIVPDCKIELMDIPRVVEEELDANVKNENHKIEDFEKFVPDVKIKTQYSDEQGCPFMEIIAAEVDGGSPMNQNIVVYADKSLDNTQNTKKENMKYASSSLEKRRSSRKTRYQGFGAHEHDEGDNKQFSIKGSMPNEVKKWKKFKTREDVCIDDISNGNEIFPICAVNIIDDEKPPTFIYTTKMIYPSWFSPTPPEGCGCIDGCSDSKKCVCVYKNGYEIPYNHKNAILKAKTLVYECGPSCKCPPSCYNRVTQNGSKIQLEIFKTESRGWGVRSLNSISSGSFICEYIGELLDEKEAEQRRNDEYLFDVGRNKNDNSDKLAAEDSGFTIDAAIYGNVGRFINHSCTPNLYAQDVIYNHDDKSMPHVMFFASEKIPPLQELTYDYNYTVDHVRDLNGNVRMKRCYCGSEECTGRMY